MADISSSPESPKRSQATRHEKYSPAGSIDYPTYNSYYLKPA